MVKASSQESELSRALSKQGLAATPWYAIVDAAQGRTAPVRAARAGLQTRSLYEGRLGAKLRDVAPHLVALSLDAAFARWLFDNWARNVGVILQSRADFAELRRHLRKFLLVKDDSGKKYRFRYYDPRVLRVFLPTCSSAEGKDFFGPVARYYAADRSGAVVLVFAWGPKGLTVREVPLSEAIGEGTAVAASAAAGPSRSQTVGLTVALIDAQTGDPIDGASVQVSGEVVKRGVTDSSGRIRFTALTTGDYEVFAIDAEMRSATCIARLKPGATRVRLLCSA
jgi:hypothetical protein